MYKLVIADDEVMIRKGLSCSINWQELGFELVASFGDGKEVLEYISDNPVDVILSDIVMCNIGGLEIAKYVYEKELPIDVILMSGYQDFNFALDAIKYHVFDYLLKPVTKNDFNERFGLLKEKLDQRSSNINDSYDIKQNSIVKCANDIRTVVMSKIWNEQIVAEQLIRLVLKNINLDINSITITMFQHSLDSDTIRKLLQDKEKILEKEGFLTSAIDDSHILMLSDSTKDFSDKNRVKFAISLLSNDKDSFLFVKKKIIPLQLSKVPDTHTDLDTLVKIINNCVAYLQNLDNLQAEEANTTIIESNIDRGLFKIVLEISVEIFCLRFQSIGFPEISFDRIFKNFEINYSNIKDSLNHLYDRMIEIYNGPFSVGYDFAMERVTKYINDHLKEDISVNTLADMVHLNPAYFGRYFKKTMSVTVKQYIYEQRMKLAIELLSKKKYTVAEIAMMVGYDFKYFFPLFKKHTGYTPREYLKYFID